MGDGDSAIVVGASSGIGRELARELAADGYEVGLAARSVDRFRDLGEELPTKSYVARMDVTDADEARDRFDRLADAPAYSASKAFVSNYLAGLRARAAEADGVAVTTIEPGYVDTDLMLDDDAFWVASPETAAEQIADAIRAKRSHAYVTRRWRLVAWLLAAVPESVLRRVLS